MVDDGSALDILYLKAYKRMGLIEDDLDPNISPFYFIPKRVVKLTITVREHPRTSTILSNFLVVDAPSTMLLKDLKAATSIYHLTMKFSTAKGTGEVRGN